MIFRIQKELPIIAQYTKLYSKCIESKDQKTIQAAIKFLKKHHKECGELLFENGDDKKHTLFKLTKDLHNLTEKFQGLLKNPTKH